MKINKLFFLNIRLISAVPIVLASLSIIYASSRPSFDLPDIGFWETDKLLHFLAYFVYGSLLTFFYLGNFSFSNKKLVFATIITGIIFALSDEFHQSFVPGRMADKYDFLADSVGIIASTALIKPLILLVNRLKKNRSR